MHVTQKEVAQIYNQLKSSAKKRNIGFTLTICDINTLGFPITCPVLGMPLAYNTGKPKDNSYSVDRIDSTKGYDIDNIVVISYRANKLKSDATLHELQRLFEYYVEEGSGIEPQSD